MSVITKKGPIFDPGMCRGCGALKKCRLLNIEYEWFGQKEVYSEMFLDTLGLVLSHLDGEESERLICATCVLRLRDATAFRRQVLNCEERLLQKLLRVDGTLEISHVIDDIKEESDTAASSHGNIKDDNIINSDNIFKADSLVNNDNIADSDKEDSDDNIANDDHNQNDAVDKDSDSDNTPIAKIQVKDEIIPFTKAEDVKDEPVTLSADCTRKHKKTKTKKTKRKKTEEKVKKRRRLREEQRIKDMREIEIDQIDTIERRQEMRQKMKLQEQSQENTLIIIENSYVCPFDTSFSDYYCFYCREVFTDPDKLREHNLTHDPATFKDTLANVYSKKTLQIDITRIDCRLCSENITDLDKFKIHICDAHVKQMHKVENDFLKFKLTANNLSCMECGTIFSFFHALKKHMAEHFGSCTCDVCGACYFDERMLYLHKKSHERIDEDFPCSDCGKVFKSKQSRAMHERKIHKKEPTYQCPKCDMVFFSYNLRYRHLIQSHGEQRLFRCDHCDKAYDSRKSLREHNRRVHAKTYLHQCEQCDRRFYLPSRLREHMSTHTGERNFHCDYCGKSYPRLRGLKVHMQSHSRDKRYKCNMCTASFTQNANLKNHVRKHHQTVEEDFQQTLTVG